MKSFFEKKKKRKIWATKSNIRRILTKRTKEDILLMISRVKLNFDSHPVQYNWQIVKQSKLHEPNQTTDSAGINVPSQNYTSSLEKVHAFQQTFISGAIEIPRQQRLHLQKQRNSNSNKDARCVWRTSLYRVNVSRELRRVTLFYLDVIRKNKGTNKWSK